MARYSRGGFVGRSVALAFAGEGAVRTACSCGGGLAGEGFEEGPAEGSPPIVFSPARRPPMS